MSETDDYAVPWYPMGDGDVRAGVSGKIVLSVAFDGEGRVREIHVVKSFSPRIDEPALKAVRTWKFGVLDGNPSEPANDFQELITSARVDRSNDSHPPNNHPGAVF